MDLVAAAARAMPWAQRAACRDAPDLTWVTDPSGERNVPASVVQKFAICNECPVRVECLRYSLSASWGETFGTWGGTTQLERRSFSRVLNTMAAQGNPDLRAAAVEEIIAFFESTRRQRMKHWQALAAETKGRSKREVPTARARPPVVTEMGKTMARNLERAARKSLIRRR